jgi:4'-phosphopantetheinyl transferase EntD
VIATPATAELEAAAAALGHRLGLTIGLVDVIGEGRAADRAAGRVAAQNAFARAGAHGLGVFGNAPDGRPQWPPGWAGSIAHGAGVAVAAVGRTHRAVGIDVERSGALSLEDSRLVLAPAELDLAEGAADPAAIATLLWSAKEAAFKAWSGACGGLHGVDPVDILVDVDVDDCTVAARYAVGDTEVHQRLVGRLATVGDVLLTVVIGALTGAEPDEGDVA